jgi:hypothetical protein
MVILINGQGSVKASIRICAAHMQRQRHHERCILINESWKQSILSRAPFVVMRRCRV